MNLIEQLYTQNLNSMTGMQKVERTLSLFGTICEMLTFQIKKEFPNDTDREIRKRVAKRLYMSDPKIQELLNRIS